MTCDVTTCAKVALRGRGLCIGHAMLWSMAPPKESRADFLARQERQSREAQASEDAP